MFLLEFLGRMLLSFLLSLSMSFAFDSHSRQLLCVFCVAHMSAARLITD